MKSPKRVNSGNGVLRSAWDWLLLSFLIKDVKRITADKNIITIKVLKVDSNINSSSNY